MSVISGGGCRETARQGKSSFDSQSFFIYLRPTTGRRLNQFASFRANFVEVCMRISGEQPTERPRRLREPRAAVSAAASAAVYVGSLGFGRCRAGSKTSKSSVQERSSTLPRMECPNRAQGLVCRSENFVGFRRRTSLIAKVFMSQRPQHIDRLTLFKHSLMRPRSCSEAGRRPSCLPVFVCRCSQRRRSSAPRHSSVVSSLPWLSALCRKLKTIEENLMLKAARTLGYVLHSTWCPRTFAGALP